LDNNDGVPLWSDANPLKPNTDCSGVQLAGFTCPAGTTESRCFVNLNGNVASSFSVDMPDVDSNGRATNINSVGLVNLRKTSDGTTWKQLTQASNTKYDSMTVSVLVVGGGGGGGGIIGGGGGGGGVVYNPSFQVTENSYNVVVGSGGVGGFGWNNYPQRGEPGGSSSVSIATPTALGSSADNPGKSCYLLKLEGVNTDGVYWIDPDGSGSSTSFRAYCDMTYDGGGWTLLLKATRGTTFNYNASYWTTNNVLNDNDISRNDSDAKYRSFNEMPLTDIMARWPDANDSRWLRESAWNEVTALTGFNSYANWGPSLSEPYWGTPSFSYESGINQHGTKLGDLGGSTNGGARWGYRTNNEADWTSDDAGGGIGVRHATYNYSAGDWTSCCAVVTGINRSARVEVYGRNKNDVPDITAAITAVGGGGGSAHGGNDPRGATTGGSGGGGANQVNAGASGINGQGYVGGAGNSNDGGGGGGGGGAGVNYGAGGIGNPNSISGLLTYYSGGGGGGGRSGVGTADIGGIGGGGAGTLTDTKAGDGTANTGGGGGGAGYLSGTASRVGGNGGTGVVIISYPTGSLSAVGGTVTTIGTNTVHKFNSSGTFKVLPTASKVKVIVIGGGGGGGVFGGGVLYDNNHSVAVKSYSVIVGNGGTGDQTYNDGGTGANGGNSSFDYLTANGGGGGGSRKASPYYGTPGNTGGSGGGGSPADTGDIGTGGLANPYTQGNNGGYGAAYGLSLIHI
jgi:hypothetical protein